MILIEVEMEFARLRALKHFVLVLIIRFSFVEMEFARLRALKHFDDSRYCIRVAVEMEFARLRALKRKYIEVNLQSWLV